MKYRIALALTLLSVSAMSQAASPCKEKEQEITREISYAEKHNNQSRVEGLNKALHEVRTTCSDSKLRAEHQRKIARQKDEVAERREDLAKAKQKGDADKISKRDHKLKEAEAELKALEARDY
ncbi:DUF1090 domain-containing protein [Phytobacter diazotrophicus]|uniref:DUF1090 domain-containing protein n=1 Tax=Phytobacter diazotrophicus TaxID=395631 RepID=UPI00232C77B4|nr:DUF1090 domain-containing protein [Phytobacter diazotrophicus]MDC0726038.1 DUF1090 domain-containing protein [Phytobacter diazotrophicus]MDC0733401.1 DUF1090 domain-containing protein [Phytobacter diazotrophicus]